MRWPPRTARAVPSPSRTARACALPLMPPASRSASAARSACCSRRPSSGSPSCSTPCAKQRRSMVRFPKSPMRGWRNDTLPCLWLTECTCATAAAAVAVSACEHTRTGCRQERDAGGAGASRRGGVWRRGALSDGRAVRAPALRLLRGQAHRFRSRRCARRSASPPWRAVRGGRAACISSRAAGARRW